jgi:hypothetical protein
MQTKGSVCVCVLLVMCAFDGLHARYVDVPVVGLEVELGLFGGGAGDGDKVGNKVCVVSHGCV